MSCVHDVSENSNLTPVGNGPSVERYAINLKQKQKTNVFAVKLPRKNIRSCAMK